MLRDGTWARYVRLQDAYLLTGPNLATTFAAGSVVASDGDFQGDGAEELVVAGPEGSADRPIAIYELGGAVPTYRPISTRDARFALADVDDDGFTELALLDSASELSLVEANVDGFRIGPVARLGDHAPIAASDVDADGLADLLVAGAPWAWRAGAWVGEPGVRWTVERAELLDTGAGSDVGVVAAVRAAAGADLVGVDDTDLVSWRGGATLAEAGRARLPTAGAVDLAVCGDRAYVLTGTAVHQARLPAATVLRTWTGSGSRVACGAGPGGAVAAVLADDEIVLLDATLAEVGRQDAAGAVAVALADGDVATCVVPGCDVVAWPLGGETAIARVDGRTTVVGRASGIEELPVSGRLSVVDVDGSGEGDLVVTADDGRVALFRVVDGAISVGEHFVADSALVGASLFVDVDGDRVRDWIGVGSGGALLRSR
jgi:hypothetical protein